MKIGTVMATVGALGVPYDHFRTIAIVLLVLPLVRGS